MVNWYFSGKGLRRGLVIADINGIELITFDIVLNVIQLHNPGVC
jgi:hypothetical protein